MTKKTKSTKDGPIKVFVSSTYLDNVERRKLVQEAITMAGMVWSGMELFTAGSKPTVEECLRFVKESDLFVGIIAHRYGWEPDGEISITEMEYNAAKKAGIVCLMFQKSSESINPEKDYDAGSNRWKKQEKLDKFKTDFSKDQLPAYFTETKLQTKVLLALQKWKKENYSEDVENTDEEKKVTISKTEIDLNKEINSYMKKAEAFHEHLPVAGFITQLKVPINIEDIYVPLRAMLDLRGICEEVFYDATHAEQELKSRDCCVEIDLPQAFKQADGRGQKGCVILGDPGSGKTTHLKRILIWCLRNGSETLGLPKNMLPVFLSLRDLKNLDKGMDSFISKQLNSPFLKTSKGFAERLIDRGNLLFLLDGLDEVSDLSQREQVAQWIIEAIRSYPTCRFVITCRFAGYSPTVHLSEDFLEMHIRPLSFEQVQKFIHNWYNIVEKGLAKDIDQSLEIAKQKSDDLIKRLGEPEFRARRVFELTRNPLLLTNICLVHRHRGALPHKRARLYEECIDVLLEYWRTAKGLSTDISAQSGRRVLQPVALWMHQKQGRTRAKAEDLIPHIEPSLKASKWTTGNAKDFLHTIRDHSGLLTGWDQESYGFLHLGFQEYLSAREIRTRAFEEPEVLFELAQKFGDSWWHEVVLLLLALEDPSLFSPYMSKVLCNPAFAKFPDLIEACLDDSAEISVKPFVKFLEESIGEDREMWPNEMKALQILYRLDAEETSKLIKKYSNHPSPEIREWIQQKYEQSRSAVFITEKVKYELVKIPGGEFMMGSLESEKGRFNNESSHKVTVADFYIGRYAVTNIQYSQFLKECSDIPEPEYWADRRFNQPQQPVVGVSWNESKKFAEWLGLRLPTEAEWEYACRAGSQTQYYFGDEEKDLEKYGWYRKNSDSNLHSVGELLPNEFGLYDMAGNAWEWCDDWYNEYSSELQANPSGPSKGDYRVLRGGGWSDDATICRSAYRDGAHPDGRDDDVGFRLARGQKEK